MSPTPQSRHLTTDAIDTLTFNEAGLIPVIVQDDHSNEVLMMAWANAEALRASIAQSRAVFWSRSRQELWRKGDTSGNSQHLVSAAIDCDGDTLLFRVHAQGPACHTGARSCFVVSEPEETT